MSSGRSSSRFLFSSLTAALAALLLISSSSVLADDVVVLTDDDFHREVGQHRGALVEFYAPWCGHCQRPSPEYGKLGNSFKKPKSVLIGKVDCDAHKNLCSQYSVTRFPTIQWFPEGSLQPKKYEGARTSEALAEFVNSEAGRNVKIAATPSNVVLLTPDSFDQASFFFAANQTFSICMFSPSLVGNYRIYGIFNISRCGHCKQLAPTYEKVATAFKLEKDIVIANLDADKYKYLAEKYGVSGFPTFKFFPKSNKAGEDYSGGRDLEDFVTFINEKCSTSRDGKGRLTSKAGIIATMDTLVKEFLSAGDDGKKKILSKMEEEVKKFKGVTARYGNIYLKAAKSSIQKGADYAKNKIQRLERTLEKSISEAKADQFTLKKNILSTFARSWYKPQVE